VTVVAAAEQFIPVFAMREGAMRFVGIPPLSCRDHEGGGGVKFQQWDGKQWTVLTDLDRHGSGAGAASGGGISGQVCTGEGHHAAGLSVDAWRPWKVQGLAHSILLWRRLLRLGLLLLNIEDLDIEM
jgi:hypothetical protein